MRKTRKVFYSLTIVLSMIILSSCATIVGGSGYWAHVKVPDHPNAKISYKGVYQGTGTAVIKVKRVDARNFSVTIEEEGCQPKLYDFTTRAFRGWALTGTLFLGSISTFYLFSIPIPWAEAVDLINGAFWKPNTDEKGITKIDFKNFQYTINYNECKK